MRFWFHIVAWILAVCCRCESCSRHIDYCNRDLVLCLLNGCHRLQCRSGTVESEFDIVCSSSGSGIHILSRGGKGDQQKEINFGGIKVMKIIAARYCLWCISSYNWLIWQYWSTSVRVLEGGVIVLVCLVLWSTSWSCYIWWCGVVSIKVEIIAANNEFGERVSVGGILTLAICRQV